MIRLWRMVRRSASVAGYVVALVFVVVTALSLLGMGRVPICKCGYVKAWHGVVNSSENSQHVTDWYTFSHVIHGFGFYGLMWLLGRRWPVGVRFAAAVALECGWEVLENSDAVINRYREATISLDYYGDSVLNSISDVMAMTVGFFLASRLPVAAIVLSTIILELFVGYMIRDNLLLNIIMLVRPIDAIKRWQSGGSLF